MIHIEIIACSIFKRELGGIIDDLPLPEGVSVHYIDSMLHIYPDKLKLILDKQISLFREKGSDIFLLYGECHPFIDGCGSGVNRCPGINCIEIMLGPAVYRKLRKEGWFFLLPEWTQRWKEIFEVNLGLDARSAREIMRESHTGLLYLDTGKSEVPIEKLISLSEYTGLPYSVKQITDSILRETILNLVRNIIDAERSEKHQ